MKYVKNLLDSKLFIFDTQVGIPAGDFVVLSDKEVEHTDIAFCLRRNWIELTDTKPTVTKVEVPEVSFAPEEEDNGSEFPPGNEPKTGDVEDGKNVVVDEVTVEEEKPTKRTKKS